MVHKSQPSDKENIHCGCSPRGWTLSTPAWEGLSWLWKRIPHPAELFNYLSWDLCSWYLWPVLLLLWLLCPRPLGPVPPWVVVSISGYIGEHVDVPCRESSTHSCPTQLLLLTWIQQLLLNYSALYSTAWITAGRSQSKKHKPPQNSTPPQCYSKKPTREIVVCSNPS